MAVSRIRKAQPRESVEIAGNSRADDDCHAVASSAILGLAPLLPVCHFLYGPAHSHRELPLRPADGNKRQSLDVLGNAQEFFHVVLMGAMEGSERGAQA